MGLSLKQYIQGVKNSTIDPVNILNECLERAKDNTHNAWVRVHDEYIQKNHTDFVSKILCGAPIGVKDIILTKGYETSCASKMLEGYIPPYSAHCFELLEQSGGCMIGKTNMDEFAMGGSNESSVFGAVKNPHDIERISGGSSGGSAVAVAAGECLASLGTDTGGSVRQPAGLCGIVGVKPTYGRVSRYGVQALASSLDQVGVLTQTVEDAAILLNTIAGYDDRDANSMDRSDEKEQWFGVLGQSIQGKKIGLVRQFFGEGLDPRVKNVCDEAIEQLRTLGTIVERVDLPVCDYAVPIYYVLMPAEASTNLARFDGVRFGLQGDPSAFETVFDYYGDVRSKGFGNEVKRRILTGAYVLSAGFYDAYYHKAQLMRKQMIQDIDAVYNEYDALVGPTSPVVAWKIGEKTDDVIANYLADVYTTTANLTGLPALSLPVGTVDEGGKSLPVGLQIMTQRRDEATMFHIAYALENSFIQ